MSPANIEGPRRLTSSSTVGIVRGKFQGPGKKKQKKKKNSQQMYRLKTGWFYFPLLFYPLSLAVIAGNWSDTYFY
jgi:hypothetical protein